MALSETEAAEVLAVPGFLLGFAGSVVVAIVKEGVEEGGGDGRVVRYELVDGF
jgi:hypothetical protein